MISLAWAEGALPKAQGMLEMLFPLALMFVVFYFLLIRPQQKKAKQQQEFLKGLKKGDEVLTFSGIFGTITGITDKYVTLEVSPDVRIKVLRSQIAGLAQGE